MQKWGIYSRSYLAHLVSPSSSGFPHNLPIPHQSFDWVGKYTYAVFHYSFSFPAGNDYGCKTVQHTFQVPTDSMREHIILLYSIWHLNEFTYIDCLRLLWADEQH